MQQTFTHLILLATVAAYHFLTVVQPKKEHLAPTISCDGDSAYINRLNSKVLLRTNGQLKSHFTHEIYARPGESICFDGLVETNDGIYQVEGFKVTLKMVEHEHSFVKSKRASNVRMEKELVEDRTSTVWSWGDVEFDWTRWMKPHCHFIIPYYWYEERGCFPIGPWKYHERKVQCFYRQDNQPAYLVSHFGGVKHRLTFEFTNGVDTEIHQVEDTINRAAATFHGIRVGYAAISNYNPAIPGDALVYNGEIKKTNSEANDAGSKAINKAFFLPYDADFVWNKDFWNGGWNKLEGEYNQMKTYEGPVHSSKAWEYQRDTEFYSQFDHLEADLNREKYLAKNYRGLSVRVVLESDIKIEKVYSYIGTIDSFDCKQDGTFTILCEVLEVGHKGSVKLLLFDRLDVTSPSVQPIAEREVSCEAGAQVAFQVASLIVDESIQTWKVCTMYGICQEVQVQQRNQEIVLGFQHPNIQVPGRSYLPLLSLIDGLIGEVAKWAAWLKAFIAKWKDVVIMVVVGIVVLLLTIKILGWCCRHKKASTGKVLTRKNIEIKL